MLFLPMDVTAFLRKSYALDRLKVRTAFFCTHMLQRQL